MTTWKKLPKEIKALMIQRRFEQKGKSNKKPFKKTGLDAGFVFAQTSEGDAFWNKVISGDFRLFFDCYPKQEPIDILKNLFTDFGKRL